MRRSKYLYTDHRGRESWLDVDSIQDAIDEAACRLSEVAWDDNDDGESKFLAATVTEINHHNEVVDAHEIEVEILNPNNDDSGEWQ